MLPKLHVVIASTRPGRAGLPIGTWFFEAAKRHGGFDVTLVDLLEVGLPFLNEKSHPRLQKYEHEHTKRWSGRNHGDGWIRRCGSNRWYRSNW